MISLVSLKDLFFQSPHCVARRKKKWVLGSKTPSFCSGLNKKGSLPLKACLSLFLFLDHINRRVTPAHKLNTSGSDHTPKLLQQMKLIFAVTCTRCHKHINATQDWMGRFLSFCGVYLPLQNPKHHSALGRKIWECFELFLTCKLKCLGRISRHRWKN